MLELQTLINIGAALVLSVVGYFAKKADKQVTDTADKLTAFQIKVAEEYVTHTDLRRIEDSLIRIEAKIDAKADK